MSFMKQQKTDNDKILFPNFTKFLLKLAIFSYIICMFINPRLFYWLHL